MIHKKSQLTVEFLLLMSFMFMIGFIFIVVTGVQMNDFFTGKRVQLIQDFGESLRYELQQASVVNEGYIRIIELPDKIDGIINYTVLVQNSTLVILTEDYDYTGRIPSTIGELVKGINIIKNKKGYVLILSYEIEEYLVSHWKLNEGKGINTTDKGGKSEGMLVNALWSQGKERFGVSFNNTNHYIEMPHNNAFLIRNGSISLWFKVSEFDSKGGLFSKDSNGYDTGGHLTFWANTDGSIESRLQSTGTSYHLYSNAGVVDVGKWHFILVTFGVEGYRLYVDGNLVDNTSYSGGIDSSSGGSGNFEPIAIGASTITSGNLIVTPTIDHFTGIIDDVRMYNRSFFKAEVYDVFLD